MEFSKMIQPISWFERQFTFDLPVWMFPNIVERLRGTPARVEDKVALFPAKILTQRDGKSWSIQEHIGHLLDLEPLGLARLDDYIAGKEKLQAADLQNQKTYQANHNAKPIENILIMLRRERSELIERLEELDEEVVFRSSLHPRLNQPMRLLDLMFFIAEHDDHHLVRMSQLGRMLSRLV